MDNIGKAVILLRLSYNFLPFLYIIIIENPFSKLISYRFAFSPSSLYRMM